MTDEEFIREHFRKLDKPPEKSHAQRGIEMHEMFEKIASNISLPSHEIKDGDIKDIWPDHSAADMKIRHDSGPLDEGIVNRNEDCFPLSLVFKITDGEDSPFPIKKGDVEEAVKKMCDFGTRRTSLFTAESIKELIKHMAESEKSTSKALSEGPIFFIDEQMDFIDHRPSDELEPQEFVVNFNYTRPCALSPIQGSIVVTAMTIFGAHEIARKKFPTITEFTD